MTNKNQNNVQNEQKKEFNYFEFMKFQVLKAYFTNKFKGEKTDELQITVKQMNTQGNAWFAKNGAFKFVRWETTVDEDGKMVTLVKIKDINLDAIAKSKEGKEFKVFNSFDISKAVKSAMKALA